MPDAARSRCGEAEGSRSLGGFDAVILAGGRARRLGGIDKPGVEVDGRALVARVADALSHADRLVLVGPPRPELAHAIVTRERPSGAGPVPAITAGLEYVAAPQVAVFAGDLPFLARYHVDALRDAAGGWPGAVLVDADGREQWLAGVWDTAGLRAAMRTYRGSAVRGLLAPLGPRHVRPAAPDGAPPPWFDCDTVGDVMEARSWPVSGTVPPR